MKIFIIIIIFLLYFSPAFAQEHPINRNAEKYFVAWLNVCKKCHGNGKKATDFGLSKNAPLNLFSSHGMKDEEELKKIIRDHRVGEAGYKQELTEDEIEIISKFIKLGFFLETLERKQEEVNPILIEIDRAIHERND